jgi:hypothetical protein
VLAALPDLREVGFAFDAAGTSVILRRGAPQASLV